MLQSDYFDRNKCFIKLFFFSLIFSLIFSCKSIPLEGSCLNLTKEEMKFSKKKIYRQIDSFYQLENTKNLKLNKVLSLKCVNDSLIEVKVSTKMSFIGFFYFNNRLHLMKVEHEFGIF